LTAEDAGELREAILQAVIDHEAQPGRADAYGQRYTVDFPFEWQGNRAVIRSGWIIEHDSDVPRLITCYPL
jgi:hypothetical protein